MMNAFDLAVTVNSAFDKRGLQYDFGIGYGGAMARTACHDAVRLYPAGGPSGKQDGGT